MIVISTASRVFLCYMAAASTLTYTGSPAKATTPATKTLSSQRKLSPSQTTTSSSSSTSSSHSGPERALTIRNSSATPGSGNGQTTSPLRGHPAIPPKLLSPYTADPKAISGGITFSKYVKLMTLVMYSLATSIC